MKRQRLDLYGFPNNVPLEFNPTTIVARGEGNGACKDLLDSFKPILRLSQFLGIAPIVFKEVRSVVKVSPINSASSAEKLSLSTPSEEFATCGRVTASCPWISLPSFSNCLVTAHLLWITTWVLLNITSILQAAFSGTDLYAFSIQVQMYFVQSTVVLLHSLLKRRSLATLWNSIHEVFQGLNSFPNGVILDQSDLCSESRTLLLHRRLPRLKFVCWTALTTVLFLGVAYGSYFFFAAIEVCFGPSSSPLRSAGEPLLETGSNVKIQHCPLHYPLLLIEKFTYIFLGVYHQNLCVLFCCFCFILRLLFKEMGLRLEWVLKEFIPEGNRDLHIEKLRILHEKLNDCCRVASSFFGIPILGSCITSLVSICSAIYTFLIRFTDLSFTVSGEQLVKFSLMWGFHGVVGVTTILLSLNWSQSVKNAGNDIFRILGSGSHRNLNDSDKYEVGVFLQKNRTPGISACNITPLGMSFVAAAATNVTTYILVLLQFRLGVDKHETKL